MRLGCLLRGVILAAENAGSSAAPLQGLPSKPWKDEESECPSFWSMPEGFAGAASNVTRCAGRDFTLEGVGDPPLLNPRQQ